MKRLLNNLISGLSGKIIQGIVSMLKALLNTFLRWDWGDRIAAFLVAMVLIGGLINASLKRKNLQLTKENEEITQELILQRTFVTELQILVQGQTLSHRQLKQSLDSASTQGVSLAQDLDMWREITAETQGMIKQLVHQRDSLKQSKIVYVDRCFNAFGNEVDCARRRSRSR